jgi:hypothetical protein
MINRNSINIIKYFLPDSVFSTVFFDREAGKQSCGMQECHFQILFEIERVNLLFIDSHAVYRRIEERKLAFIWRQMC